MGLTAGLYAITSNGNLYAWYGTSLTATLQTTPVATLSPAYYENPNWLINPTPQGAVWRSQPAFPAAT